MAFSMISSAEAAAIGKLIITETSPQNALKQMGQLGASRTVEDTAAESEQTEKVKKAEQIEKIAKPKSEEAKEAKEGKIKIASSKPSKTNPDGDLIQTDDASE